VNDWDQIHKLGGEGILTRQDIQDFSCQRAKVLRLMFDGCWHQADQILAASGGREGLRRLRELREIPGIAIDRRPHPNRKRDFMYRLTYESGLQQDLF
jgi:hypothetical protein